MACAIVRHAPFHADGRTIWDLVPQYEWFKPIPTVGYEIVNCHEAIDIAERHVDGLASADEWRNAELTFRWATYAAEGDTFGLDAGALNNANFRYVAAEAFSGAFHVSPPLLSVYLQSYRRYQPQGVGDEEIHPDHGENVCRLIRDIVGNPFRPVSVIEDWLRWNWGTVPAIARHIYDDRAFHDLPILADALMDAGCDNAAILDHCRSPGPHVRGCWVVDRLLGNG